jgi:hypothetical protein
VADESKIGTDWQDEELDAIVADYFAMLAAEQAGEPYVKAHHARALMQQTGRTHRSVEFKHMNLSAVLSELGLPTIRGYKAKANYQGAIFGAVDRFLSDHPDAWTIGDARFLANRDRWAARQHQRRGGSRFGAGLAEHGPTFSSPFMGEGDREAVEGANLKLKSIELTDAPVLGDVQPRPEGLKRLVRKFDPAARDARNRALGRVGEQHIYDHEITHLIESDRIDLAKRVEWTSEERGDGAGYDIRSFDPASGQERFIEVKTTRGGARTDFFLSRNERAFSDEEPERFRLYRLYDAAAEIKLFALKPPLGDAVRLSPETWRAGF